MFLGEIFNKIVSNLIYKIKYDQFRSPKIWIDSWNDSSDPGKYESIQLMTQSCSKKKKTNESIPESTQLILEYMIRFNSWFNEKSFDSESIHDSTLSHLQFWRQVTHFPASGDAHPRVMWRTFPRLVTHQHNARWPILLRWVTPNPPALSIRSVGKLNCSWTAVIWTELICSPLELYDERILWRKKKIIINLRTTK